MIRYLELEEVGAVTEAPLVAALQAHLDRFLGQPTKLHHFTAGVVHVREHEHVPSRGMTTYASVGLCAVRLQGDDAIVPPAPYREEFILTVNHRDADERLAWLLAEAIGAVAVRGHPVLWGEVLDVPRFPGWRSPIAGLWCTGPQLFPAELQREPEFDTWIGWLIPVLSKEVAFITREGWHAFGEVLERTNADYLSLRRGPVV